jgi:hypothetical protein
MKHEQSYSYESSHVVQLAHLSTLYSGMLGYLPLRLEIYRPACNMKQRNMKHSVYQTPRIDSNKHHHLHSPHHTLVS